MRQIAANIAKLPELLHATNKGGTLLSFSYSWTACWEPRQGGTTPGGEEVLAMFSMHGTFDPSAAVR